MKKCFRSFMALAVVAAMVTSGIATVSAESNVSVLDNATTGFSAWTVGATNSGYEGTISTDTDGNMVLSASKAGDGNGNTPVFYRSINNGDGIPFTDTNTVVVSTTLNTGSMGSGRLYLKMNRPDSAAQVTGEATNNVYSIWTLWESSSKCDFWFYNGTNTTSGTPNWSVQNTGTYTANTDYNITAYIDGATKDCTYVITNLSNNNSVTYSGYSLNCPEIGDDDSLDSVSFTFRKAALNVTIKEFKAYAIEDPDVSIVTSKYSNGTDNIQLEIKGEVKDETTLPTMITLEDGKGQAISYSSYSYKDGIYTIFTDEVLASDVYTVTVSKDLAFTQGALTDDAVFKVKVTSTDIIVNDTFENETDISNWISRNTHATVSKVTEDGNSFARVTINSMDAPDDLTGEQTHPVITRYVAGGLERKADGYTVIETKVRWFDDTYRNYFKVNYPTEQGDLLLWETANKYRYDNGYGDVTQNFFTFWWRYTNQMRMYNGINKNSGYSLVNGSNGQMYNNATVNYAIGDNDEGKWYTVRMVFDNAKDTLSTVLYDAEGNIITSVTDTNADIWYIDDVLYTLDFTARQTSGSSATTTEAYFDFDDIKVYNTSNSITIDGANANFKFVKTSELADAAVFYAAYDSTGKLKDVKVRYLRNKDVMAEINETLTLEEDITGCTTKAFVWKIDNIKPVMYKD